MSQNKNLPVKMGLTFGAALGVVVISVGIIRYKTGMILRGDQTLSLVYWVIFALSIFFAVFRYKKLDPLSFSFSRTTKIGLFAGLLSGTMYTIYIILLNNYIDTEISSADSLKISSAVRGLIYIVVCMTFGIAYSLVSTVLAKRFSFNPTKQT